MTIKSRQTCLIKTVFAGAYVFSRRGKIKPLYTFAKSNLTDEDGTVATRFVIQGVNDASAIQPESAPLDITKLVACLVPAPDDGLPSLWETNAGRAFTKADLTALPSIQALIPEDDSSYHLMLLPRCLPILFGQSESHRGSVDENCQGLLEENLAGGSHWASWLALHWSQDLNSAVAAVLDKDIKAFGDLLPKLKKAALPLADSLVVKTTTLYADEDEDAPGIDSLRKVLFKVVPAVDKEAPPTPIVGGDPLDDTDDMTSASSRIPRKKTANSYSEEDQLAMKYRLACCGYDEKTGALTIPELTVNMDHVFTATKSNARRCEYLAELLESPKKLAPTDMDFLHRVLDMPAFDRAALALLANSRFPTNKMYDMDGPHTKLRIFMFAPDDDATAKFRESSATTREMEMLVGEETTNLTKMSTDIIFNNRVLFPDVALAMMANRCFTYEKTVQLDEADWDAPTNPLGYRFYKQMALLLTDVPFRMFAKSTPSPSSNGSWAGLSRCATRSSAS